MDSIQIFSSHIKKLTTDVIQDLKVKNSQSRYLSTIYVNYVI